MIKKKYAFFGYRIWAQNILNNIKNSDFSNQVDSFTILDTQYESTNKTDSQIINPKKLEIDFYKEYNALFFYGWSWLVPKKLTDNIPCICLHPSPLPLYRGGSPIQNQILADEKESAITLFKITQGIDDGPIYYQEKISLEGGIKDIFDRISVVGSRLTLKLLKDFDSDNVKSTPQDESKATLYKRLKASDSALTIDKLKKMTSRQIYNHIRCHEDPYPNSYLVGSDGGKIYLKKGVL